MTVDALRAPVVFDEAAPDTEGIVGPADALFGLRSDPYRANGVNVLGDDVGFLVNRLEQVQVAPFDGDRLAPDAVLPEVTARAASVECEVFEFPCAVDAERLGNEERAIRRRAAP